MTAMTRSHLLLFLLTACGFMVSLFFKPYPLSWLVKILPILVLLHFSWQNIRGTKERAHKLFMLGLVFSIFGDFFLDYDRVNWFVLGLAAFLVAHLFYIFSLKPLVAMPIVSKRLPVIGLYCIYGVGVFLIIYAGLGDLFIPVLVYMTILLLMGITTLLSQKANIWLIIGGLSFILSDSFIGLNQFYHQIPYASVWIMTSYYFAQLALVNGMFTQDNNLA
ncbi:MAG: alkenylglycerophosphocholine/alkenylglycerophosphoethanolamine hydrolase [Colwellia sp.]|jgi:alkenylglycerophosphocholine/alkenylglycerophosphoethanolamine hydrolase